jgi:hypothetical protein
LPGNESSSPDQRSSTFPELNDVVAAAEGIAVCIEYAAAERLEKEAGMFDRYPQGRLCSDLETAGSSLPCLR